MHLTGIILAGGKSSRLGKEKGLAEFRGKPLISYAIHALGRHCSEMIISAPEGIYEHLGVPIVPDEYPGKGPMMGIYSALKASGGPAAVVLSCDMPFVSDNLVGYLLALRHKGDVVVPWHGGDHWEPLCAVYDKAVLRKMESFIKRGCYKLPDMFPEVSTYAIPAGTIQDIFGVDVFFNVNTPRDLTVVRGIE